MSSIEKVKLSLNEHSIEFVKQLAVLFVYDQPEMDVKKIKKQKTKKNKKKKKKK